MDDHSGDPSPIAEVHSIYADREDSRPRFIITARALETPIDLIEEQETESEQEATEHATDETDKTSETEESVTEERFSSTESGLFTSTSAPAYQTELASTIASVNQSLVARTGEAADNVDASPVSPHFYFQNCFHSLCAFYKCRHLSSFKVWARRSKTRGRRFKHVIDQLRHPSQKNRSKRRRSRSSIRKTQASRW